LKGSGEMPPLRQAAIPLYATRESAVRKPTLVERKKNDEN
jgi:hypothetical protein